MVRASFTESDLRRLRDRGIDPEAAERQLEILRNPPPPIELDRPATRGDGIIRISLEDQEELDGRAARAAAAGRLMLFVPASGAATRMFQDLRAATAGDGAPPASPAGRKFFGSIAAFPFAEELGRRAGGLDPQTPEDEERILRVLLDEMAYAETPKGLILFHRTPNGGRTAFEEHLLQGRRIARASDGTIRAHFTVSAEHREAFEKALAAIRPRLESGCRLDVGFSVQHPSTDVLALDPSGEPFRDAGGELVLRPSGHGALLPNLESLRGDIVVIRNIDNVLPDEGSGQVIRWKKTLIGALVRLQEEVFEILHDCAKGFAAEAVDRGITLARERFGRAPGRLKSDEERVEFVRAALDRPLRVCGVVHNAGEPGGAPFWVAGRDGHSTPQIVEASQVDLANPKQKKIFEASTHFNPVDIIAGMRRWNGEPFQLTRFVDPEAVFIVKKAHEGRELLALERPGLWNGSMAGWNTVFVEVPASTFAPVKTVFDLLRPAHQVTGSAGVPPAVAAASRRRG
jgi:hypothetical protein